MRKQNISGTWIYQKIKYGEKYLKMRMVCSNCKSAFDLCCNQIERYDADTGNHYKWAYCPWCGANMMEVIT
jgi:hypothetical protein